MSGNAAAIFIKCKDAGAMAGVCKRIDELYRNSDYPTRTQTEEAFGKMFGEMLGDLKNAIYWIGPAVVVSLIFVAGNAMAMAMRERTTEVAVLKAIGFSKGLVLFLVMAEAVLVAGIGGARRCAGLQGSVRRRRHLAVTRPGSCRSSTFPGTSRLVGHAGVALDRLLERRFPGDSARPTLGHRRPQEGDLSRHDPAQVQRPQPAGALEDDTLDRAGHRPGRLVVVHPVRHGRGAASTA